MDTLNGLAASEYFSLMVDTSPDVSNQDVLLLYVRYMGASGVTTRYLCAVNILETKTSDNTYKLIIAVLDALCIDKSKLAGFCSDGDSTFRGSINGIVVKLRDIQPWVVAVHCATHRCALIGADCGNASSHLQELDGILASIHRLFCHSPGRQRVWERFARKYKITRLKWPRYNSTRWFSRAACIETLAENVAVLLLFLKRVKGDKKWQKPASDIYQKLNSVGFLGFLFAVGDLVKHLEFLRLCFEKDKVSIHNIHKNVDFVLEMLQEKFVNTNYFGSYYKTFEKSCSESEDDDGMLWSASVGQEKVPVKLRRGKGFDLAQEIIPRIAQYAIMCIKDRFPNTDICACFKIFEPHSYAHFGAGTQALKKYGREELRKILDFFCAGRHKGDASRDLFDMRCEIVQETVKDEFRIMKAELCELAKVPGISVEDAWMKILQSDKAAYMKHMIMIAKLLLVVPPNTAIIERGFSLVGLVKTKHRNRTRICTLDALMRVRMGIDKPLQVHSAAEQLFQSQACNDVKKPLVSLNLFSSVNRIPIDEFEGAEVDLETDEDQSSISDFGDYEISDDELCRSDSDEEEEDCESSDEDSDGSTVSSSSSSGSDWDL